MPGLESVLGNPVLEQIVIWQLAGTAISTALEPYVQALRNTVNGANQEVPLSPADLAEAVIRNVADEATAAGLAAMSGVSPANFHVLTLLAGNAPAPEELAVALRRGLIDEATYDHGIRQGRLRDEWATLIRELAVAEPSPTLALTAALKGQIDQAAAKVLYEQWGADPGHWDLALATEGAGPSPLEAAEAARRGIIPWDGTGLGVTSFEQAVHESAYRNKWDKTFRALAEYLPPPRTITAMVREGSLTEAQASDLLAKQGVPADLIPAYLSSASHGKTATHKELAVGTVKSLYRDRLIAQADASGMLVALGYNDQEAGFILALVDVEVAQRYLTAATNRVHALYVGHKIDRTTALSVLANLKLPQAGIDDIVSIWDWERSANVKTLTEGQVVAAFHEQIIDQAAAQTELETLGYLPHDAWLLLSIREKVALPNEPPASAVGPAPGQ